MKIFMNVIVGSQHDNVYFITARLLTVKSTSYQRKNIFFDIAVLEYVDKICL